MSAAAWRAMRAGCVTRPGRRAPGISDRRRSFAGASGSTLSAIARGNVPAGQHRRVHQAVAAIDLDHAQLAGIERAQLFLVDVDALDLAAVLEMAGDLGLRVVEHLALQERLQLRPGLAAPARLFLALALGALALLLLALGADGVSLGEVDVLALAGLAAGARCPSFLAPALRATGSPGRFGPFLPGAGFAAA